MAPTFLAMLHSLSLRMPMNRFVVWAMLLSASKEMPFVNAASPKMQTTFSSLPRWSRAARHAERGGQRRAGVARAVTIMLALGAQREAVQAVRRADGVKAVLAAGQQLVDVALVAHVPDKFVLGRGEDVVQREGQFDHAEVRAEMAAVLGQLADQLRADLLRQLVQLLQRQFFDVGGFVHHIQISAHILHPPELLPKAGRL